MKTIEERAKEFASEYDYNSDTIDVKEAIIDAYIEGATDQQLLVYEQIISRCNIVSLIHYLDEHRPKGEMYLSSMECKDFRDAWNMNDWAKIIRYIHKYEND